jgi:predicted dehydrogenase
METTMATRRSRRQFLQQSLAAGSAIAATGYWSERARAVSKSPNEQLNIGVIGAGGRGRADLEGVSTEHIVAVCDIDEKSLELAANDYSAERTYVDFRKLLDEGKDLDAIVVATPEHTHAVATLQAIRMGKHVYCEKPLAHSVYETRVVREAAKKHKVVTQMGTQIHAEETYRRVVELIQSGAIGDVTETHVWVSRDWGGGERPTGEHPIPKHIHWDLWIGPAPMRPFHTDYLPGPNWYKFWDFGNGVMPDLGSHWNDLPFWALKLGTPTTIEAEGPPVSKETAPQWLIAKWTFPARENMPACKLTWYHGGKKPDLVTSGKVPMWNDGVLFVGEKGMLLADYSKHVLLPEAQFKDFKPPAHSIPKSKGHHAEWIHACKTNGATTCNFDYSGNLTESNLLGNVAYRTGKKLEWDAVALKATHCPEADALIKPEYRNGWTL